MILFTDEDMGTTIPRFLKRIGLKEIRWLIGMFPQGAEDVLWLARAGRQGWLVFSCNKAMLNVEVERDTIIREKVGIVFLTSGQENLANIARLLLNKWTWLESIDQNIERPFVFFLYPSGRNRRIPV